MGEARKGTGKMVYGSGGRTKGLVREKRILQIHFVTNQCFKETLPLYGQPCILCAYRSISDRLLPVGGHGGRKPSQGLTFH